MDPQVFYKALDSIKEFPTDSPRAKSSPHKLIGIIGGEPLLHPQFDRLASIMADVIPDRRHRGLWTGLKWESTKYAEIIAEVFDTQFIHNNLHKAPCYHSPVLVAISDLIKDPAESRALIERCWLQERWSSSVTPKGLFHCEVAGCLDYVFNGPGGLSISEGCWDKSLSEFEELIQRWCPRCGIPLNLKGRLDSEEFDDVSSTNLTELQRLGSSKRVNDGHYFLFDGTQPADKTCEPWRYK
jgi:hypothetical protein